MKRSRTANDNLIDQTIALWQSRLQRDLSREDARQIVENVTGFFNILTEWSRAEVSVPANDNAAVSKASSSAKDQPPTTGDAIGGAGVVMTDLLAQLNDVSRSGDGWTARCPAHADRHNSLSIPHRNGRWLLKCHAGSRWQKIMNALGIQASGLFVVRWCGWEARSPNDKKLIGVYTIDAANTITAEVTS